MPRRAPRRPAQPPAAPPGLPYGERARLEQAQRAVPLAGDALPPPSIPVGLAHAPDDRPEVPVFAGLEGAAPPAPAPGPPSPGAGDPSAAAADLEALASWLPALEIAATGPTATPTFRQLVRSLRAAVALREGL